MLMKQCANCRGDGFFRLAKSDVHPQMNVANARTIWKQTGRYPATLAEYHDNIAAYEFDCLRCQKTGEIVWRRGKSLTPVR